MILWFLLLILCSASAVAISYPLIRHYEPQTNAGDEASGVYQDQIKEVERDLAAGTISPSEAVVAISEIERRLAAISKNQPPVRPLSSLARMSVLVTSAAVIIVGGVGLYALLGRPDLSAPPPSAIAKNNEQGVSQQMEAMIVTLRERLKTEPGNPKGWQALGFALIQTGKPDEAAAAFAKASALVPDNMDYKSAEAEALIQAAQGIVTPAAQQLLDAVLAKDPKNARSRFYDALASEQAGDKPAAFERWSRLLADAPADATWRGDVRARLVKLGTELGKDVSAFTGSDPKAPDQSEMIKSMVQKLADKLAANPKDLEGWGKLMRSYQVLGQGDLAKAAYQRALSAFEGEQPALSQLSAWAKELGLN